MTSYYARNREKVLAYQKKYREEKREEVNLSKRVRRKALKLHNPTQYEKEKILSRNRCIKNKYGISAEEGLRLRNSQCEICGKLPDEKVNFIDHCHTTGKVRGSLCIRCNGLIAAFEQGSEWEQKAKEYLAKYSE